MSETKICQACKEGKPLSEFYFRKETGKYRAACKKCKSVNTKAEIEARMASPTKVCKHCNAEKAVSEYQKAGGGKWLQPYCKPCDEARKNKHRNDNVDRYNKLSLLSYHKNKKLLSEEEKKVNQTGRKEKMAQYYEKIKMSPEEKKRRKSECDKRYRENNKEKILITKRKYYALKGNEQAKEWQRKRKDDIAFMTKKRLRGRIYVALKRGIKSDSTMKLLGCSIEYFKQYFESLFTDGMSWGKYMEGGIHIDHKIPCKNFDLTKPEEQKICFHYSNLQPLWELDNLRKGTSLNYKQKVA